MTTIEGIEHRQSTGWVDPAGCGVSCECGVTYDGFDTLEEACDLLDEHIREATPATATRGRYAATRNPLRKWLPYAVAALVLFAVVAWAVT
jgi:hypothetical protein